MTAPGEPELDLRRILGTFERHGVDYILVGGAAAQVHWGRPDRRRTPTAWKATDHDNFERIAAALRDLNARLRAEGLTDAESKTLPVRVDGTALGQLEISTWMTDAGPIDVFANLPDRTGRRVSYDELVERAPRYSAQGVMVRVAALADITSSKQWADRPKDRAALPELEALQRHQRLRAAPPDRLASPSQPDSPGLDL